MRPKTTPSRVHQDHQTSRAVRPRNGADALKEFVSAPLILGEISVVLRKQKVVFSQMIRTK